MPHSDIQWRIKEFFPELNSEVYDSLTEYFAELQKFNQRLNLVSPKSISTADVTHFADSILAHKLILTAAPNLTVMGDFGSGNGFPGLVFAVLSPALQMVLVESDSRKAEFLKHMAHHLGVASRVKVLNQQLETLEPASLPAAVCRGFASITQTLLKATKAIMPGGIVFNLKGEEWGREVASLPSQLCTLWTAKSLGDYELPVTRAKLTVVAAKKLK